MKTPDAPSTLEVPDEQGFRFQHGPVARSHREFATALAQAPTSVVFYHREHYVPWVRDVLQDAPLARRLDAYLSSPPAPDVYRDFVVELVRKRVVELQ